VRLADAASGGKSTQRNTYVLLLITFYLHRVVRLADAASGGKGKKQRKSGEAAVTRVHNCLRVSAHCTARWFGE
jgi:hypothetical protein